MRNEKIDRTIEEIKKINLIYCIMLKYIADNGTLSLETNEKLMLLSIADIAIKRSIEKGLFPKNVCADDLREIFPDVEILREEWKNSFISKFCTVV